MANRFDSKNQFTPEVRTGIQTGVDLVQNIYVSDTIANLKGVKAGLRDNGQLAVVTANDSRWRFDSTSTAVDTTDNFVVSPTNGLGKWLRVDKTVPMKIAVAFGTADAATLFTVPAGVNIQLQDVFWEVTADWTGGTSSAIGISSADAPHSTQGDLLGGAAGSLLADLTAAISITSDPRGASFTATPFTAVLKATDTIRFDRITSAFTAGTGFVHVVANQIQL